MSLLLLIIHRTLSRRGSRRYTGDAAAVAALCMSTATASIADLLGRLPNCPGWRCRPLSTASRMREAATFSTSLPRHGSRAITRWALILVYSGLFGFLRTMPLAVFQMLGWWPICMQVRTRAVIRGLSHSHRRCSAPTPM